MSKKIFNPPGGKSNQSPGSPKNALNLLLRAPGKKEEEPEAEEEGAIPEPEATPELEPVKNFSEEKYNKAIAEGDKLFKAKQYERARLSYKSALSVKPDEAYPKGKIDEIGEIVKAISESIPVKFDKRKVQDKKKVFTNSLRESLLNDMDETIKKYRQQVDIDYSIAKFLEDAAEAQLKKLKSKIK
jgi:hypothetical protein